MLAETPVFESRRYLTQFFLAYFAVTVLVFSESNASLKAAAGKVAVLYFTFAENDTRRIFIVPPLLDDVCKLLTIKPGSFTVPTGAETGFTVRALGKLVDNALLFVTVNLLVPPGFASYYADVPLRLYEKLNIVSKDLRALYPVERKLCLTSFTDSSLLEKEYPYLSKLLKFDKEARLVVRNPDIAKEILAQNQVLRLELEKSNSNSSEKIKSLEETVQFLEAKVQALEEENKKLREELDLLKNKNS